MTTDCCTNWHGMVMHKSILTEEYDWHDLRRTQTAPCNSVPQWHLGMPFSNLPFQLTVKRMHIRPVHCYHVIKECNAFISPMLQKGGGKNMPGSLVIVQHVWNPLCTNFLFPQGAGENMSITCWRDSYSCSNCLSGNTVCMFKDRFHLFCHRCWGSTVKGAPVSSQPFFMAFTHLQNVSYEAPCAPKPSFNNL
jgi:hypothetical protein